MTTPHSFGTPENYSPTKRIRCGCAEYLVKQHGGRLDWRGGERVLDIGCGVGDVLHQCFFPLLPHNYRKLLLTDLSPKMLEFAKKEFHGVERVDFMQIDIGVDVEKSLNDSFDKIFSSFCINFVKDQRKAFENVYSLLAPGGECLLILSQTAAFFEAAFQLINTPKWEDKLKHYRDVFVFPYREDSNPEMTLRDLLESIGFCDVFVKKDDYNCDFPTIDSFRECLRAFPDFPNNMTQEEKEELLEDQVKMGISFNIIGECRDDSKPNAYPIMENLTIYAKKKVKLNDVFSV